MIKSVVSLFAMAAVATAQTGVPVAVPVFVPVSVPIVVPVAAPVAPPVGAASGGKGPKMAKKAKAPSAAGTKLAASKSSRRYLTQN